MTKLTENNFITIQSGFTIIEIMIAITVFAIGIISINILQTSSLKGNIAADLITGKTSWAAFQIENLEQTTYAQTVNGTLTSNDGKYTANWTVINDSPTTGTKTVTMTVGNSGNISTQPTVITWVKAQF